MQLTELAAAGDRLDLRSLASHGCLSLRWLPRERLGDADELFNRGLGFLELADRRVDMITNRVRERGQVVRCDYPVRVWYVGRAHVVLEPSGVLADSFSRSHLQPDECHTCFSESVGVTELAGERSRDGLP